MHNKKNHIKFEKERQFVHILGYTGNFNIKWFFFCISIATSLGHKLTKKICKRFFASTKNAGKRPKDIECDFRLHFALRNIVGMATENAFRDIHIYIYNNLYSIHLFRKYIMSS